ncbi:MAG: GAF domain-containing protein [Acidobacteria bacterium]|nr:GAF domain-containing protein [Candidatus Sulfomarinibacter sp. MAG AM1]
MECISCVRIFEEVGDAFNSTLGTEEKLEQVAQAIVKYLNIKSCHFRVLSRDQRNLEHVASFGLSERFLNKGAIDAEKSVAEALKGHVVMVEDCANDPRIQFPKEHADEGIVSLLTVPLSARGNVIGVMRLATKKRREFSEQELTAISTLASFSTSAITHSMFHYILGEVAAAVRSSLDLKEVLESTVRVVCESLRVRGSTIRLLDRRGHLELRAAFGLSQQYLDTASSDPGDAVAEALKGTCVAILDARMDPRIRHHDEMATEKISSVLFVPLMSREEAIGVLSVYTHNPYNFSDDEKQLMTALGEQCALSIRNAQMYHTIKRRYEHVVDDFQQWFEHYETYPVRK